jgi:hypothetical protein
MMLHLRGVLWFVAVLLVATLVGCKEEKKVKEPEGIKGFPSAAGVCSLPAAGNCDTVNNTNVCTPGGSCNVGLAINSNQGVDLTLNNQPLTNLQQIVCVPTNATINWSVTPPPGGHSSILLDFGNAAPFNVTPPAPYLTYATGSDTQSVSEQVASSNGCYKYNVKVCPIPATAGPTALACGESDPKIIVGSGTMMHK